MCPGVVAGDRRCAEHNIISRAREKREAGGAVLYCTVLWIVEDVLGLLLWTVNSDTVKPVT